MNSNTRRASLAGGLILLLVALSSIFIINKGAVAEASETCGEEVRFFALEEGKESPGAFGPAVAEGSVDEILAELRNRRCQDPALTASHAAAWGMIGESEAEINALSRELAADPAQWRSVIDQLEALEAESSVELMYVPSGVRTQYMAPSEEGWVDVFYGTSGFEGNVIQFTNPNGITVQLRLLCGFQPTWPPTAPPPVEPPPVNPVCPWDSTLPPDHPDCLKPKSSNPDDYVYPADKPKVPEVTAPAEATPPPVVTEVTGGRGVVDTPTSTPGSESGVTAPGAAPAPTTPPAIPANQGGDNAAGDPGGF